MKKYKVIIETSNPSYRAVSMWLTKFKDGRKRVKDDVRSGRPNTVTYTKDLLKIKELEEREGEDTLLRT